MRILQTSLIVYEVGGKSKKELPVYTDSPLTWEFDPNRTVFSTRSFLAQLDTG